MRFQQLTVFTLILFALSACLEAPNNAGGRNKKDQDIQRPGADSGTDNDLSDTLRSHAFRGSNSEQYTMAALREFILGNTANGYPDNVFEIPNRQLHDMDDRTVVYVSPGPNKDCGLLADDNAPSIGKRIADCKEKFKNLANARLWNGNANGIAGEGNWILVLKKGDRHIWMDETTNLIWTDNIKEDTWPNASGSEVDVTTAVCNNEFLAQDVADENTDFFAGLTPDEIKLRLPTRNDFLQADLNGARFVLDDLENKLYWTANYISDNQEAWVINQKEGILGKRPINAGEISVRCLGIVLK